MPSQINAIRRSQIGTPNGVMGINADGAAEAIVSHRSGTLAELQAIGILPEGEVVVEVNGSGVPVALRVGDEAETPGGYPVINAVNKVSVTNLTLSSTSLVVVPGLSIILPDNSLVEISMTLRTAVTGSLNYTFLVVATKLMFMLMRDGATTSTPVTGVPLATTGPGRTIVLPPTLVRTDTNFIFQVLYQKTSGATDLVLSEGDISYKVL